MPRPKRWRWVEKHPETTYFKPAGIRIKELDEVILTVEEYEAINLKDLQDKDQETASKQMKISQPTFHRLIIQARKKIADAIINGKAIKIQGGRFKLKN